MTREIIEKSDRYTCALCGGYVVWDNDFMASELYGDTGSKAIVSFFHCCECGASITYETEEPEKDE